MQYKLKYDIHIWDYQMRNVRILTRTEVTEADNTDDALLYSANTTSTLREDGIIEKGKKSTYVWFPPERIQLIKVSVEECKEGAHSANK
mgnify:CR=1 FL=1